MARFPKRSTLTMLLQQRSLLASSVVRSLCILSSSQQTRRVSLATSTPASFSRQNSSFITTPIFYVNSAPHIGHLYSALLADVVHRWRKLKGEEGTPILSTGTDEHGMKIQKVATAMGKEPKVLCDEVSGKFKDLFDEAGISYTHYVRTTDEHHIQKVQEFWNMVSDKGYIYKGRYEGWYCVSDEAYLSDMDVTSGSAPGSKISIESGHPVEWSSEENYIFRLTDFREQLLDWVKTPPYPIVPEFARQMVITWLEDDKFADLSISRPRRRLSWGIPVPNDQSQTIYVWLDALVNYLTVSDHPLPTHTWPPTEHVVGKDILRFHGIFWPAFLLAAGLQLPKKIVTHSHWIVDNYKMSKSKGNVINPLEQFSLFGVEQVRYFLLKQGYLHQDGEYSMEWLVTMVNADLANTLGNLLLRISSKKLNSGGKGWIYHRDLFPFCEDGVTAATRARQEDHDLIRSLHELPGIVEDCYETFQVRSALEAIMTCLYQNNKFIVDWAPWFLVKDPSQHPIMDSVLLVVMESLRLCSSLLLPVIPRHASTLLHRLGFPHPPGTGQLACMLTEDRIHELEAASVRMQQLDNRKPLFTKVVLPEEIRTEKDTQYI